MGFLTPYYSQSQKTLLLTIIKKRAFYPRYFLPKIKYSEPQKTLFLTIPIKKELFTAVIPLFLSIAIKKGVLPSLSAYF